MKSLRVLLLSVIPLLTINASVKAEVAEIRNPSWQLVPNSIGAEVYVNTNGLIRNGNLVTYDIINDDASYTRLQANCTTNQYRSLRQGDFVSASRVSFVSTNSPWNRASKSLDYSLINFVCSR
ncbi:hypothetical protein Cyast_0873 [Cyanobacterium stanieri PCC 7202]|uniref:Uncharacterized protein n=1 Tax=Cyanobacterium stanieri (strain ATCC 29140 / PCC 7202) TaxID=292563 RepID=K9YKC6_CYASC|nr:hypothetical protein Cyast_0873 [Cyanobacterium stanieri PCC 7202]